MVLIVSGTAANSGAVYLVGSVVSGVGFGISFHFGLRGEVAAIPRTHRAGVMSAFYLVAYGLLSAPAVLAGLVVGSLGLQATFEAFGLIAAFIALIVAARAWRSRPAAQAQKAASM